MCDSENEQNCIDETVSQWTELEGFDKKTGSCQTFCFIKHTVQPVFSLRVV